MNPIAQEFAQWLDAFLPDDYYTDRYREYRWDLGLRRDYQRAAFEAGWLQPTWPREHGGRSLGLAAAMEVRLEAAMRAAPKLPNIAGPNVAAPGIREFGTPAQIDRLLVPVLRGDEWWALGMSEPEAGSDFAGLRTRADRDDDVFRINGRKIWSTQAHLSRWCTLYARTDQAAPKHKGISCFALDMELDLAAAATGTRSTCDMDLLFERQDSLAATLYGGTSEIQRNIIGERLLGLPKG